VHRHFAIMNWILFWHDSTPNWCVLASFYIFLSWFGNFHIYSLLNQQKFKIIGKNAPKIAQLHKTSLFTSNNTLWKFHMISRYLWCTYPICGDVPGIGTLVVVGHVFHCRTVHRHFAIMNWILFWHDSTPNWCLLASLYIFLSWFGNFHIYSLLNQQKFKIIGKNALKIAQLHKISLFTSNNTLWKFHMMSRYLWCTYLTCGDVPCIGTLVVVCMPHIYSMCARETLVKWVGSLVTRSGNYYSYITAIVTY
jgi:hypothetical protein